MLGLYFVHIPRGYYSLLTVQPLSNVATLQIADEGILYHYGSYLPNMIISFDSCLDLSLWRNYDQPFACAIVNSRSHEVILVRDHLGVEPLYYCCHLGKKLIFAQTIPDILKHLPSTPPLLEKQINMLFSENKYYSDETLYQGIYRVEPGSLIHFKTNGSMVKKAFWKLDPHKPMLHYDDDRDYHDHFSMLMNEALLNSTKNKSSIAAEFSAGLDSSAVYCAAANINVKPKLYMHVAHPDLKSANTYNDFHEKAFIDHYQLADIQRIGADRFEPLQVFNEYASWFAGPAPYLFPMFANPLHRAVAAGQHTILLSGFGGDQCVSGQLSLSFFLPELLHQGEYRQAWRELKNTHGVKKALLLAKHMHPILYSQALNLKIMKRHISNVFRPQTAYQSTTLHPYEHIYYPSVREAECSLLQGTHSHEVRMRIEYSSIVSKQMGFEYRYPLLYPKLVEFMLRIPTVQKRRDGRGRYLIRQYLSQFLPEDLFDTYRKKGGLPIVPSTFDLYQRNYAQGCYQAVFKDLPYSHLIKNKHQPIELRNNIKGFMLRCFLF
jgi:asparagine synthase (glutamine-hydrolysing)